MSKEEQDKLKEEMRKDSEDYFDFKSLGHPDHPELGGGTDINDLPIPSENNSIEAKDYSHLIPKVKSGFMKADLGKTMFSLVEPKFIEGVADTLTMGAKKYAVNNWQKCEDTRRYKDALLRHLYAYLDGEITDPESGLSHLYHVGFNCMALDYFDRGDALLKSIEDLPEIGLE